MDDRTTNPGQSTGAAHTQDTEDGVGLSAASSGSPGSSREGAQTRAGDTSSPAGTAAVEQPLALTNEAPSAAVTPDTRREIAQERNGNSERDDTNANRTAREENAAGDVAGGAGAATNTLLPIRTLPDLVPPRAAPVQTTATSSNSRVEFSPDTRFVGPDGQVVAFSSVMYPLRSSFVAEGSPLSTRRRSSLRQQFIPPRERSQRHRREVPEFSLPRWQPDAEVTLCPICHTQFSIWVRKHHCRKCGRVVCNSCSPHRITIPNQYIVRPPDSDVSFASSLFADPMGASFLEHDGMPGGERVRLCNPCVPDPNTAPPQSPTPHSPRSPHHRSRSSLSNAYGGMPTLPGIHDSSQYLSSRTRSIALNPSARGHDPVPTSSRSASYQTPFEQYLSMRPGRAGPSQFSTRPGLFEDAATPSSSRHRALPPTPQIAEEDECPICHRELPATTLPDFETQREQHITACIQSHSTYGGSPSPLAEGVAPAPPRRSGMYTYAATEKDCVDDAECTICLEEFAVGVPMARLECLCRFHRACIAAWFVNHPGRCPVHQHDGFGF
ncbi:Zinc finger, FYVE-type [Cordyceps fumosorosea ARSEF 2679]|uniref:RING-type E3 ubiquitin transferase n=1 Tax=Cordyceps fumosorosea (strain ARSEF 2679) TaxID=1081104 RepID=A0A167ZH31_CORFA|nr:Zinc finger, FYVE-type [Cordyceps fumosorosea ARSEF 2679]OAA67506.1 Zinc finger, FYVE-type [Cordyceps fumosorosea ARSEF 2679]